jgi:transcriptional regulator with XRE-family HTH domain
MAHTRPYPSLKHWREAHGYSQRVAAKRLGITQSAYSKLETGQRAPRKRLAKVIVEETCVPLEVLMGIA